MKRIFCSLGAAACMFVATTADAASRIDNPGFEAGDLSGWSVFGLGWRIGSNEDVHSGTNGIVNDVLASDTDEWRGVHQSVQVNAGSSYTAEVFIRAVNVHTSSSWLELQWLDKDDGIIAQLQSSFVTSDQAFTRVGLDHMVAPPGTVTASVRGIVYMPAPPAEEPEFHIFDDFSFRPKP